HEAGHLLIQRLFAGIHRDPIGAGPAAGELQADGAAAIADHHVGEQAVQLVHMARGELVFAIDEVLLKLLGGSQQMSWSNPAWVPSLAARRPSSNSGRFVRWRADTKRPRSRVARLMRVPCSVTTSAGGNWSGDPRSATRRHRSGSRYSKQTARGEPSHHSG